MTTYGLISTAPSTFRAGVKELKERLQGTGEFVLGIKLETSSEERAHGHEIEDWWDISYRAACQKGSAADVRNRRYPEFDGGERLRTWFRLTVTTTTDHKEALRKSRRRQRERSHLAVRVLRRRVSRALSEFHEVLRPWWKRSVRCSTWIDY